MNTDKGRIGWTGRTGWTTRDTQNLSHAVDPAYPAHPAAPARFAPDVDCADRSFPLASHALGNRGRKWTALLDRIAAGDAEAVGILYDESSNVVFSLILHVLQNRQAAEDALLDAYVRIRQEARRRDATQNPVAWIVAVARRTALERLRHIPASERPAQWPAPPAPSATSVLPFDARHRQRHEIVGALDLLNPRQRLLVRMTYFGGLTIAEVADRLHLSIGEVRSDLGRVMTMLRNMLGE
jgi:RNA polymerase sigma-70 factor, ECF subfamily